MQEQRDLSQHVSMQYYVFVCVVIARTDSMYPVKQFYNDFHWLTERLFYGFTGHIQCISTDEISVG